MTRTASIQLCSLVIGSLVLGGCGQTNNNNGPVHYDFSTSQPDFAGEVGDFAMTGQEVDMSVGPDMACHAPTTLHPPKANEPSIYCPFSETDAGKAGYCQQGTEHCCEPTSGTSVCQPTATPCGATDTDWQCEDTTDCPNGQVCCGIGSLVMGTTGCENYGSKFKGTHCEATCMANEIQMCTSSTECNGKTCYPFATKGNDVGACQ